MMSLEYTPYDVFLYSEDIALSMTGELNKAHHGELVMIVGRSGKWHYAIVRAVDGEILGEAHEKQLRKIPVA